MYRVMVERAIEGMFEHSKHSSEPDAYQVASDLYEHWKFLASIKFARSAVRVCIVNASGDIIFRFGNI